MLDNTLESRIDYIRTQIKAGEFTAPAREATAIIETAFRELYRRSIGLLNGQDRLRVYKVEEQIGGGTKSFDEFTMGQLVALFRNSNFLEAWSKVTNNELRGIRMINLDEVVRLRNQLVHSDGAATHGEAELLFQCLQAILETFGILSLDRVTTEADALPSENPSAATKQTARSRGKASTYRPTGSRESNRLAVQAQHAAQFDKGLLSEARAHIGTETFSVMDIGCADGAMTIDRFADAAYSRVLAVDRDADSIDAAIRANPEPDRFAFLNADVDALDFEERVADLLAQRGWSPPDVIFSALTIHHLANPIKLLRTCRYLLSSPGAIVLRGSDDGSKVAYPDEDQRMRRVIEATLASPGVSDRMNGRKIYHQLYRAGFRKIQTVYDIQDTSRLDQSERRDLFVESFSWRRNYLQQAVEQNPGSVPYTQQLREMDELLDELEYDFEADGFYYAEIGYGAVALVE